MKTERYMIKSYILFTALVVMVCIYRRFSLVALLLLSVPDVAAGLALYYVTRPVIVLENNAQKLVSVCSLNGSGLVAFLLDTVFWGMVAKTLVAFSRWWSILYLGIPFSFVSEFLYKPYKSIKKI